MPDFNNLFEDFNFTRVPGKCWVCEAPISAGLFCALHDGHVDNYDPEKILVRNLKPGDEGYVPFLAIFVRDDIYYIIMNALVKPNYEPDYFKIRVTEAGQYRLDIQSVGTTHVMEYHPDFETIAYQRIYLENQNLISKNDFVPTLGFQDEPVITTIKDLHEWQIGYTVPWGIFSRDGLFWIRLDCTVSSVPEGQNLVKVRRNTGLIEIDCRTLHIDNVLEVQWPDEEMNQYEMVVLVKQLP